ncbi:MAG: hypothetical protein JST54_31775 [Deltaproteobacteria bacterium]|nr:hypothetical protein [Deltaproteobacteria bacterium]
MPRKIRSSSDVIIRTPKLAEAVKFYERIGLKVISRSPKLVGLDAGAFTLYVEKGKAHGPVFDFLVADVQKTKVELVASKCRVVEENPKVPRCYLRDPYGMVFNLGRR